MNNDFCRLVATHLTSEQVKEQRKSLREAVLMVLASLCLAGLVIAATEAYGAEVPVYTWSDGKTTINLMPGPCTDKVVKPFLESVGELEKFKAIESQWLYKDGQKKTHGGCWAEFSKEQTGTVALFVFFFDDGDKHVVEKSEFLKKPGTIGV